MNHFTSLFLITCCINLIMGSPSFAEDILKTNIVKIDVSNEEQGTGIVIGQQNSKVFILTAYHVIVEGQDLKVSFFKDYKSYNAKPLGKHDENLDIAVIIVEDVPFKFQQLPISNKFIKGDKVWSIGHPYNKEWRINHPENAITNTMYDNDIRKLSINQAGIRQGSSGGAIYSTAYEILAMIVKVDALDAIGIKLHYIKPILDSWNIPTNYLANSDGLSLGPTTRWRERKILSSDEELMIDSDCKHWETGALMVINNTSAKLELVLGRAYYTITPYQTKYFPEARSRVYHYRIFKYKDGKYEKSEEYIVENGQFSVWNCRMTEFIINWVD